MDDFEPWSLSQNRFSAPMWRAIAPQVRQYLAGLGLPSSEDLEFHLINAGIDARIDATPYGAEDQEISDQEKMDSLVATIKVMIDDLRGSWESLTGQLEAEAKEEAIKRERDRRQEELNNCSSEELNDSPFILVRCENYMLAAKTRRNMYFYNQQGTKIRVIQAFPIKENMLDTINGAFARDGLVFKPVEPPASNLVYALDWSQVNRYVAEEISPRGLRKMSATQEIPPEFCLFDAKIHTPTWYLKESIGFLGQTEGEYMGFDIQFQVVISPEAIAWIDEK